MWVVRKVRVTKKAFELLTGILLAFAAFSCSIVIISIAAYEINNTNCNGAKYPDPKESLYILPYEPGTSRYLSQANCDGFHDTRDWFAYDFDMPIGTAVIATRQGVVTGIQEKEAGDSGVYRANTIEITHNDSTFASYLHLADDSFLVEIGDKVDQGEVIGCSGSAGNTGPRKHLHFVVFELLSENRRKTLPVTFSNVEEPQPLKAGKSYRARAAKG